MSLFALQVSKTCCAAPSGQTNPSRYSTDEVPRPVRRRRGGVIFLNTSKKVGYLDRNNRHSTLSGPNRQDSSSSDELEDWLSSDFVMADCACNPGDDTSSRNHELVCRELVSGSRNHAITHCAGLI